MSRTRFTPTPEQLMMLRRNLTDHFGDRELRTLCSEMGVDYEHLRGQGKAAKASELVRQLAARGRILELVALASRLRPNISWGDLPTGLAAGTSPRLEMSGVSVLERLGWLAVVLIVVTGLALMLRGGLHPSTPGTAPGPVQGTSTPLPMTDTPPPPTSTPAVAPATATLQWTPPPAETSLPPMPTNAPAPTPTRTLTPTVLAGGSARRTLTLLAPAQGACVKSLSVTFKWTGAVLSPGESFLVALAPGEIHKAQCSSNNGGVVHTSPPLLGYEWTRDLTAPSQVPAACAGLVEWTVYIQSAAGIVTQAAPVQIFEWNPLTCK